MSMAEITLSNTPEDIIPLLSGYVNTRGITIQNKTQGPIYIWTDVTDPTTPTSGFMVKSSEFCSFPANVSSKIFIQGIGDIAVQY